MSSPSKPKIPATVGNGKFELGKRLGFGCFGEVYRAVNSDTKEEVAVKMEDVTTSSPQLQLEHEAAMLQTLRQPSQPQGFAEFYFTGREGNFHCLVMEFLGKSLEDRVQGCGGKLTPRTCCLVAEQIIIRIEYLHSKGILHRDIKPENFMFGVKEKAHHLYLIDFGLSKKYWDGKHAQMQQRLNLTGTARYASINAHRGVEQSRRDDLEAIGHMLLYFLRGHLPWSGLEAKSKAEKYRKIKETKEQVKLSDLCHGFPTAFQSYLTYARELAFSARPDYAYCRKLFADLRADFEKKERRKIESWHLEWIKDPGSDLVPLLPYNGIVQPDDVQNASKGRGMLCCFGGSKVDD
mmetsp:Transcript_40573/g.73020  ORF Transcript_40573/g.73020 Transcript_40573/m.73020 type:complete len:350 (+) Transcript_40573:29-1078(+)